MVKANAYGHGAEEVVCALSGIADCFAVALIEEGLALRVAACGKDILVFTPPTDLEEAYALLVGGLVASIPDLPTAKLFASACQRFGIVGRAHLKVNTGMNRYGMRGEELQRACALLKASPLVRVEGIYSHLYTCESQIAEAQRVLFLREKKIAKGYFPSLRAHLSATYGALLGEEFSLDMVRVGLGLYGYTPLPCDLPLKKAMSTWAKVTSTGRYEFGGVGYGEKGAEKGAPLTLLRVGYADGLLRQKDNGAEGFLQNVNNLCMDGCIRICKGERGNLEPVLLDADKTAKAVGTISYEVLCAATRRAEFIYVR